MTKFIVLLISPFLLIGCAEDPKCECLADEIDYLEKLYANGQIVLGPTMTSEACKNITLIDSDSPIERWLDFTSKMKGCSRFAEYMKCSKRIERLFPSKFD